MVKNIKILLSYVVVMSACLFAIFFLEPDPHGKEALLVDLFGVAAVKWFFRVVALAVLVFAICTIFCGKKVDRMLDHSVAQRHSIDKAIRYEDKSRGSDEVRRRD
jgi:hypothetical protein